ncbi:MAG: restriction endonuclease subunit S [Eubacteriales bacterium]|nr:restriction endonuclease subunit S [Eubacteriales bacterium]
MKWETVRLGDSCSKIGSGATPRGGSTVYRESGISLIRSQNVYNLTFDYNGLVHISDEAARRLNNVTIEENDILLNITGDSVARTCVVPKNILPARVNQHVSIIRPICDLINYKYLAYYLASPYMQAYMLNLAVGKGASRNALTKGMIEDFTISLPPIETQHRIADILSAYDDLIENNQKQIKLLEEAAMRLYKEWFVNLHFPGYETTKIVDGVPEGWSRKRLIDIAYIMMGQSPKSEYYNDKQQGLPFHQGVSNYGFRFITDEMYSTSYTRIAEAGSILFSVRAPVGRMNITKYKIVIGRGLAAVKHKDDLQSFLFYLLKKRFYKDNLIGNGAIYASITKDDLYSQEFLIPSDNLANEFNTITKEIDQRISNADRQITLLQQARDRLLPKLMSGEIEV